MDSSPFTGRLSRTSSARLWALWALVALAAALGPLAWHIEYFGKLGPRAPSLLTVALAAAAGCALLYAKLRRAWFWRWEPAGFLALAGAVCLGYEPRASLVAAAVFLVAYGLGDLTLDALRLRPPSASATIALASAAGLAWLAFALFLLGLAGLMAPVPLAVFLLIAGVIAGRRLATAPARVGELFRGWGDAEELRSPAVGVAVFLAYPFTLFGLSVALSPAINSDALRHHLVDVRRYLDIGYFETLPTESFTFFPKAMEVLLTLAHSLGGPAAAELLNPVIFFLTLLLGYALARHCGIGRAGAILGVLAAGMTPFFHWTGVIVKNDFLLALFQLGALYAWLRSREDANDRWLFLSVFLLGASCAVKHIAAFGAIPIALLYLWSAWRRPRLFLSLAVVGLLFGFYWHFHTYLLAGDPFYPLGVDFGATPVHPQDNSSRPAAWILHLSYPWIVHFNGHAIFESPSHNPAGMFLVFASAAWLLIRRRQPSSAERTCLFFCLIYFLYWGWIWGVIRYFLVPFLLLVMFTAARLEAYHVSAGRRTAASVVVALTFCFVFAIPPTMMIEVNGPQLRYLSGQLDREGYLREAISGYRVMEYLAQRWQSSDLVLNLNNIACLYAPDPHRQHYSGIRAPIQTQRSRDRVAQYDYDWVIFLTERERAVEEVGALEGMKTVYQDEAFSLARRAARSED